MAIRPDLESTGDKGELVTKMFCISRHLAMEQTQKLRPNIMCSWEGVEWQVPLFTLLPGGGPLAQAPLVIKGTGCSACLSPNHGFQFPPNPWNYSDKPTISSHGNQAHPILLMPQSWPASHSPGYSLCVQAPCPCGPASHAVSSSPGM